MKKLNELYDIEDDRLITGIKINSKEVEKGDLFVCTMGVNVDRHEYIDEAIAKGAVAIVVSREIAPKTVPIIKVENTNQELLKLCAKFYDYPYQKLQMIGVTGTNGKTTIAEIVYQLLGDSCAYLGTNGKKYHGKKEFIRNTTPDVDRLYRYLAEFVTAGCCQVCMEASSEAFFRHRLDQIDYDIAVLSNITEDHLNIHKTLENYIDCKCQLFRQVKEDGYTILNSGDQYYERVKNVANGTIWSYGFRKEDTLFIKKYEEAVDHTLITFVFDGQEYQVKSPFIGSFNVLNLAAALLVTLASKKDLKEMLKKIETLTQIEGRMEILPFFKKYTVMLDYAHTPDALEKILCYLNKVKKHRIITVTGSAGGREQQKRPAMGQIVLDKSDFVIFTMDDPREEDVNKIIDDLIGTSPKKNYQRIIDRREAITTALAMAEEDDLILIAGKGRDNYMALGTNYVPYSDYEVIEDYYQNTLPTSKFTND